MQWWYRWQIQTLGGDTGYLKSQYFMSELWFQNELTIIWSILYGLNHITILSGSYDMTHII